MHAGVFLDRDGTINEEVDFLASPSELHLIPGSAEAIREANQLGLKVFVITNQSGIARGLLTEHDLSVIHKNLLKLLEQHRARIDAIYYCPHHPDYGDGHYRADCDCRKPKTGMLERAAREFDVDLSKSFVIGDRLIDIQAGNNAGATSILVLTGYGKLESTLLEQENVHADYVAEDLQHALDHVKHTLLQTQSSTSKNHFPS